MGTTGTQSERQRVAGTVRRLRGGERPAAAVNSTPQLLVTIDGAAQALACSRRTVEGMLAAGDLHAVRIGARAVRIAVVDLERYIAKAKRRRQRIDARHAQRDDDGRFAPSHAGEGGRADAT